MSISKYVLNTNCVSGPVLHTGIAKISRSLRTVRTQGRKEREPNQSKAQLCHRLDSSGIEGPGQPLPQPKNPQHSGLPKAAQGFPNLQRNGEKQKNKGEESMLKEVGGGRDGQRTHGSYTKILISMNSLLFLPCFSNCIWSITHGASRSLKSSL